MSLLGAILASSGDLEVLIFENVVDLPLPNGAHALVNLVPLEAQRSYILLL